MLFEAWVSRCSPNSDFSHARNSFGTTGYLSNTQ